MLVTTDILDFVGDSLIDGEKAAWTVATGGEPDLAALDRWAEAMEVLRVEIANERMWAAWIRPTEEDVSAARHLVQLIRDGVPREALVDPARRVFRVTADPNALDGLCSVLPWLAGEATRIVPFDHAPLDQVRERLDRAVSFFERGGEVAGFVPTPDDLARVRRLREIAMADGAEALAERRRLAAELWARLPQDEVSAGVRRMVAEEE